MLLEPFHYPFIQRALLVGCIIGVAAACLGTIVVLRRMSLVGHALSHSALPGLVIAFLLGVPIFAGAMVATVLTALAIGFMARDNEVYEDTAIGMIPTVMFAVGILLMSLGKFYRDLFAMLFGNILGVSPADIVWISLIAVLVLAGLVLFYKEIKLVCVDPDYARTLGIPVRGLRYGLLVLLGLTVVAGIQAVGTVLTSALLVLPAAAARLLTDRLNVMMALASGFAMLATLGGVLASYYFGFSSGAAIVLFSALIFACAWGIGRLRRQRG